MKDGGPRMKSQYISLPHLAVGKYFFYYSPHHLKLLEREAPLEQRVTASLSCKDLRL